jgi:hypothetical protein
LVKLDSSRVLTVNHVFDIMLQFQLCRDWSAAFLKVSRTAERCLERDIHMDTLSLLGRAEGARGGGWEVEGGKG